MNSKQKFVFIAQKSFLTVCVTFVLNLFLRRRSVLQYFASREMVVLRYHVELKRPNQSIASAD